MNFAQHLSTIVGCVHSESQVHAHAGSERADLYHAFDGGATELEVANFLNALVYLFKPSIAFESGTGGGYGTIAIANGLATNGFGTLHTVELNGGTSQVAQERIGQWDPAAAEHVQFHVGTALDFILAYEGEPFDFAFFDSLVEIRHHEFRAMLDRGLLEKGALCAFHDSSRLRREYFSDSNVEMIADLDAYDHDAQRLESEFSRGFRLFRIK